jgi:hypothetical protein
LHLGPADCRGGAELVGDAGGAKAGGDGAAAAGEQEAEIDAVVAQYIK